VITIGFPDLYVQEVPFPQPADRCGQWQLDMNFPELRVRKVGANEIADFTILYDAFRPGLPNMR
jgi:hypothetical protein